MTHQCRTIKTLALIGVFILAACQSSSAATAAVLASTDSQTMARLETILAAAMNAASVEIGPGDLTKTSTIAVLPPRLNSREDRSVVKPILFDVVLKGSRCYVVRQDDGAEYELDGVSCRPLAN